MGGLGGMYFIGHSAAYTLSPSPATYLAVHQLRLTSRMLRTCGLIGIINAYDRGA
jgi:hypothetical protein